MRSVVYFRLDIHFHTTERLGGCSEISLSSRREEEIAKKGAKRGEPLGKSEAPV
jgi:hypothetical protein